MHLGDDQEKNPKAYHHYPSGKLCRVRQLRPQTLPSVQLWHVLPTGFRVDCSYPVLNKLALNLQVPGLL